MWRRLHLDGWIQFSLWQGASSTYMFFGKPTYMSNIGYENTKRRSVRAVYRYKSGLVGKNSKFLRNA